MALLHGVHATIVEMNSHQIQKRWESSLEGGFLIIPVDLLKNQKNLDLENAELAVLLNLLTFWHFNQELPILSISALESRLGLNVRSIQRLLKSLETKEFLSLEKGPGGERRVNLNLLVQKVKDASNKKRPIS